MIQNATNEPRYIAIQSFRFKFASFLVDRLRTFLLLLEEFSQRRNELVFDFVSAVLERHELPLDEPIQGLVFLGDRDMVDERTVLLEGERLPGVIPLHAYDDNTPCDRLHVVIVKRAAKKWLAQIKIRRLDQFHKIHSHVVLLTM